MISRSVCLASAALFLTSCGSFNQINSNRAASSGVGNAIVIEEDQFAANRGTVVRVIQNNVRGVLVSRQDGCPHITLRGGASRSAGNDALVYVDGQRFSDSCILENLDTESVGLVEVYPSGVTSRPGYHSNSGGLILVFMKDGSTASVW